MDDLTALVRLAEGGDPGARDEVAVRADRPLVRRVERGLGRALEEWVGVLRDGGVPAEVTWAQLEEMRKALAPVNELEGLLVERVLLARVALEAMELGLARWTLSGGGRVAEAYDRRVSAAHRRYLEAIKVLAQVQRLPVSEMMGRKTESSWSTGR